jgi:hypothetical protein
VEIREGVSIRLKISMVIIGVHIGNLFVSKARLIGEINYNVKEEACKDSNEA